VVSVLSNLSLASGLSSADGANGRDKQSSFAIEGLEHTLLSKGTVTAKSEFGGETGTGECVGFGVSRVVLNEIRWWMCVIMWLNSTARVIFSFIAKGLLCHT